MSGRTGIRSGKRTECIHDGAGIPFPVPGGAARSGAWCLPDDPAGKTAVYPGANRCGKNDVVSVSCRAFRGRRNLGKIFYLTAKTITRTVAWEAFEILKKHGLRWKSLLLTAKEKLCVCENMECNPAACARAKGHFERVNDAVFELLEKEEIYDREMLLSYAEKYQVCPYEMSLDLANWVDGVICDYNYVFDPQVYLRRFLRKGSKGIMYF